MRIYTFLRWNVIVKKKLLYLPLEHLKRLYNTLNLNTMEAIIAKIKEQIAAIEKDIDKIDNKAAKARVRKATLALEKLGKEYRKASI